MTNSAKLQVSLTAISFNDDSGTRLLIENTFAYPALLDGGTTVQILPIEAVAAILEAFDVHQGVIPCDYRKSNASLTYTFGGDGGPSFNVPLSALIVDNGTPTFSDEHTQCNVLLRAESSNKVILGDSFLPFSLRGLRP